MANLTSVQIKDSYQSVLTTSETTSDPTTGTLQNGKGTAITALTVSGTVNATTLAVTGNATFDTNTLFVDAANDRVGVGTITPSVKIETTGAVKAGNTAFGNEGGFLINYYTANAASRSYRFLTDQMNFGDFSIQQSTTQAGSTYADRLYIGATGNVGIGTSAPATRLDVKSTGFNVATFDSTFGQMAISFANSGTTFAQLGSGLSVTATGGASDLGLGTNGQASANIVFATGASYTERMRIDASGNVGIGVTDTSGGIRLLVNRLNANQDQPVFAWTDAQDNTGYMGIRGAGEAGEAVGGASIFADGGLHFGRMVTGAFSERMRITSDASAYLRLASGTGGIQFNGDTSASNALDDYEEGTWTIGITFGGAAVGVTYLFSEASYTKIGRQVTATGIMVLTSKGSSAGDVRITGLPFTIPNDLNKYCAAALRCIGVSFANQYQAEGVINSTTVELSETTEAGVRTNLTQADIADNANIIVTITYFV
jgi:hypothetical protein